MLLLFTCSLAIKDDSNVVVYQFTSLEMDILLVITLAASSIATTFILRLLYLVYTVHTSKCDLVTPKSSIRTIICIGSGGHTSEMLCLTKKLNLKKYRPRLYVLAENDVSSQVKIQKSEMDSDSVLIRIPRSRNVNQSYTASVLSTIHAILCTVPVVYKFKPDLVFCNGPGTCIPVCIVAFIFRCLFLIDCRIVFVESICRVRTLSLTGKILQFFADEIIIQWPQLRDVCYRAKFFGRLT